MIDDSVKRQHRRVRASVVISNAQCKSPIFPIVAGPFGLPLAGIRMLLQPTLSLLAAFLIKIAWFRQISEINLIHGQQTEY